MKNWQLCNTWSRPSWHEVYPKPKSYILATIVPSKEGKEKTMTQTAIYKARMKAMRATKVTMETIESNNNGAGPTMTRI
jgi:hypothetical protein